MEERKREVLAELQMLHLLPKLENYRLIDELHELRLGFYVRWIPLDTLKLTNGGFISRVTIEENGGHVLVQNQYNVITAEIIVDHAVIFQKLSATERAIQALLS